MAEPELLVGRYEVVRVMSEGRRASVLQAIDRVHDRPVALKVYPARQDDHDDLLAEARVLMNLTPHRGLPVVRGDFFASDPDRYVVVMNWVEGTNLQDLLDDDGDPGLPLPEVLDVLAQVADALDHLHGHDPPVVHGDVKPENLVRTDGGRVVLVDFDIAAAESTAERVGTLGYVAPEVGAGDKPGPAADVHGLAATAVTLLNGHAPNEAIPAYPGLPPAVQGQLARVLRAGLASDPTRRPKSAGRLVANLRSAASAIPPSGVVALLAFEVADAGRLWVEEPEEMRTAMGRLRDLRDQIIEDARGWVATSMNEGDRTIAVFHEASVAATSALQLHERLASASLPPGMDLQLCAGLAVGEASLVDGVYVGAVIDHVLRLRASAAPGTTLMSEPTAELLVGLVGSDMAILPLGALDLAGAPGARLFALHRPGAPPPALAPDQQIIEPERVSAVAGPVRPVWPTRPIPQPIIDASPPAAPHDEPRPSQFRLGAAATAAQHPATLVPAIAAGVALIYLVVLSAELGMAAPAAAILAVGLLVASISLVRAYSAAVRSRRRAIETERQRRQLDERRVDERHALARRFAVATAARDAATGVNVLDRLGTEIDAVTELLQRSRGRIMEQLTADLPGLTDKTYSHGIAALSDALQLLEFADGTHRQRLEEELADLDRRVTNESNDERERARDELRQATLRQVAARQDDARQRARDLLLEAERCASALARTRIELASTRRDDDESDLDQVVHALEDTITGVRDVQDELRQLGY